METDEEEKENWAFLGYVCENTLKPTVVTAVKHCGTLTRQQ